MFADFVDFDDVRMRQPAGRLCFRAKTLHVVRVGQPAGEDHLKRDRAIERDLAGAIHDAHTAAGHFDEQFIIAEPSVRRR